MSVLDLLYLVLGTLIASESLVRWPFLHQLGLYRSLLRRVLVVIRSDRVSDHWKTRAIPLYAAGLLQNSLLLALGIVAIFLPVFLSTFLVAGSLSGVWTIATTPRVLLGITALSIFYVSVRRRLRRFA